MSRRSPQVQRRRQTQDDESEDDDYRNDMSSSFLSTDGECNELDPQEKSGWHSSSMSDSLHESMRSRNSSSFQKPSPTYSSSIYPKLPSDLDASVDSNNSNHQNVIKPSSGQNHQQTHRKKKDSPIFNTTPNVFTFCCILALGIILIAFAAFHWINVVRPGSSETESEIIKTGFEVFQKDLKLLQSSFPSQTKRFWHTILASARHVYSQVDPCYPSIILIAAPKKDQQLVNCLSRKIAVIFSASQGVLSHESDILKNVEDIQHLPPEQQKKNLDDKLKQAFEGERGNKAIVIGNIQALSPKAVTLLHGFCDGDNAPFKDVMIVLTFHVDDAIVIGNHKRAEQLLSETWSRGLDMDKLSAILSRVANNVVVLQHEESSNILKQICS